MTSRREAVQLLEEQHGAVAGLLAELDEDAFARRGTIGGGEWSAKDLAAHLGSWEEFSIDTLETFRRGERPAIEDAFGGEDATDRLNDQEVERFIDALPQQVLSRFEDVHRRLVSAIESATDEVWTSPYPFDPDDDTLGQRIGSLLGSEDGGFTHASAHLPDLRGYVDAVKR